MPTSTARAAIPYPVEADYNDIPQAMHDLAQRVDDVFALSYQGLISARPTTVPQREFYWASDDRGGKLYYGDGSQWWEMGPAPWSGPNPGSQTAILQAPGIMGTADPVAVLRGKSGQTGDLTRWQDPTGATTLASVRSDGGITSAGTITAAALALTTPLPVSSGGTGSATQNFVDLTTAQNVGGIKTHTSPGSFTRLGVGQTGTSGAMLSVLADADASIGIITKRFSAAATADLFRATSETNAVLMSVSSSGGIFSAVSPNVPGLVLAGNGGVIDTSGTQVRFYSGTTGVSAWLNFPAGITLNSLTKAMVGLDLGNGSQSGYAGGEIRFADAGGEVGISTLITGSQFMNFDHRGAGNTGQWAWRSGTNAGSIRMTLKTDLNIPGGNLISRGGDPSNEVQIGIVGGGAAAGIQMGSSSNYIGMTSGSIMSAIVGGTNRLAISATGLKLSGYSPGTTHESNRADASAQVIGGRGFTVAADGYAFQGGVTAGISVAMNRTAPAVSFCNAGGDTLQLYQSNNLTWRWDVSGNMISAGLGGTPMTFSGNGVVALHNANANPFSTPTQGGVLYATGGALRWRGSAGTDTQIAAA